MKQYEAKSVGSYISHFYIIGSSFLSREYEKYGIGFGQYQFLLQLYLKDGISHDELTELVAFDKATTTRAIKKLESAGYVKTILNEQDKRKYHIYLTEKALAKRDEIFAISILWENKLIGSLDDNELSTLKNILKKIEQNIPEGFHSQNK